MALQKSALNRSLFKVKNLLSSGINTSWASNEGSTVEKDSFGSPVPYDTSLEPKKEQKISKAMEAYLERARKYNAFYKEQLADFEIGKRHLANMMGQDPEFFTQKDIDEAIEYLFPSGLFEPRARPMMKHPDKIFPRRKEAEFDESGRPFHPLFYTVQPNFYQTLSDMVAKLRALDVHEDKMIREGKHFVDKKCRRKSCWSKATVVGNGVGKYVINGVDFRDMFPRQQDREQLLFPLQFTGFMNKVDVDASVDGGGPTGQAGAVRVAVSRALRSFVGKDMLEQMRIAGLLTIDPRLRERKKPGQEGARRKFTWKKR
ncbi:small ribosomal subunit protein uS9m-like [Artemia franciscana]|uniref:small ribosomal subunit protein uS9m-like n=1 Tax=Artemia franciscana TaxID=6661 RepID=UPI0032DA2C04